MEQLKGEYGFFTEFDGISEQEARERVRLMVNTYNVREFQFYDAFRGYSNPPEPSEEFWHSALFSRPIRRRLLMAYADEIRKLGGRSWFYVQAVGTDPGDVALQQGFRKVGSHVVMNKPLLDIIVPNRNWAKRIAERWAQFIASLGFTGVHWDTLGNYNGSLGPGSDFPGFLEEALPIIRKHGLQQTANFVDGQGWSPTLWKADGQASNVIAFPYWEVWTVPKVEDKFQREVVPHGGGVFVCYPGKTPNHEGERENQLARGIWPFDLLIMRWKKARCMGNTYLAIGDGNKHIQTEYFPDTASISDADKLKLLSAVFDNLECPTKTPVAPPVGQASTTATTSTSGHLKSCYEENTAWDPMDIADRPMVDAKTPDECQARCQARTDCQHFSFYPEFGHCHLEDAFAVRATGRLGFVSGPAACNGEGSPFSQRLSHSEMQCLEPGVEYLPMLGDSQVYGKDLPQRVAILQCQQRCTSISGCMHFTVTRSDGGLTCTLAGELAHRKGPFLQKLSGPRVCGQPEMVYLADTNEHAAHSGSSPVEALVALFFSLVLTALFFYALKVWSPQRRQRAAYLALEGPAAWLVRWL